MPDAVVIGAGPNGLVAANLLADRGWDVVVLEAQPRPGGAVRSAELVEPGFVNDVFSAFYPLAAASPVIASLGLGDHGLRWCRAPLALAHPAADGTCPVVSGDVAETAASLDAGAPGDGDAWRRVYGRWERLGGPLLDALLSPFPPVRAGVRLVGATRPSELAELARFLLLPVRRLGEEEFAGEAARRLLAGCALHTDVFPESPVGGLMGWLLASIAQERGWPVPEGGAGRLADALVARLAAAGGELRCATPVTGVVVRG
ncbi:MAG: phytoene desaturase family protein, partial [Acidimicrobiales bacterium]